MNSDCFLDFDLLNILISAFNEFKAKTCIRWKRRKPGDGIKNYVTITMPYANQKWVSYN